MPTLKKKGFKNTPQEWKGVPGTQKKCRELTPSPNQAPSRLEEAEISEVKGPEKEAKKDEALKAGIKRIQDFGWGIQNGKRYVDKDGDEQKPDEKFLDWLEEFLHKYKVG